MSFSASTSAFLKATLSMVGFTGAARTTPNTMRLLAAPAMAERPFPPLASMKVASDGSIYREPFRATFGRRLPQSVVPVSHPDPHLRLTRDGIWELLAEQDQENAA